MTAIRHLGNVAWGLWFVCATSFAVWEIIGPWRPHGMVAVGLVMAFFMLHPPGAAWMIYRVIRYEERPFTLLLMAGLPYSYVWYYFERSDATVGRADGPATHPRPG